MKSTEETTKNATNTVTLPDGTVIEGLTITLTRAMAEEVLQWAEDEMAHWPSDTLYNAHLTVMIADLRTLIAIPADLMVRQMPGVR